jgi:hypothetical protein
MVEPSFMKLGMYIKAPEPISTVKVKVKISLLQAMEAHKSLPTVISTVQPSNFCGKTLILLELLYQSHETWQVYYAI